MPEVIKIHPSDNVMVALADVKAGEAVTYKNENYNLIDNIPAKHKFAITDIGKDEPVWMYGIIIGKAMYPIKKGQVISTANVKHDALPFKVRPSSYQWQQPDVTKWKTATFMGYHRPDGQVGTRNYWLVIPLVFCENRNVEYIKNALVKKLGYAQPEKYESYVDKLISLHQQNKLNGQPFQVETIAAPQTKRLFENIDGVKFLTHQGGCGGTREDSDNLCKLLAGYVNNPNVAGATVLSLGCQHAQYDIFQQAVKKINPAFDKPVLFFEQQKNPSEEALLEEALLQTFQALTKVNTIQRKPATLDKLVVGLKCGGSDGFSGITANPAMGHVSDLLASIGGKTILSEFPELCGVEQELIDRCVNVSIAEKFSKLMTEYNTKAEAIGSGFSMNPSPGNIKDGLITDAMKSAGAAKKGGSSPVQDVLDYAEYVREKGLNLLCTPGNDVEATTGMAGSGANLIIFSTGLGTPTGNPIVPVVKTATNSSLTERLGYMIDFNHGDIITKGKSIDQSAEELLEFLISVASGKTFTKAEQLQQDDFIPWKRGVSL